jgi:hypothetical protein
LREVKKTDIIEKKNDSEAFGKAPKGLPNGKGRA